MSETPISQADIDGLAAAVDGLDLPGDQQALLSAIVEQFRTAFTPDATFLVAPQTPGDVGRIVTPPYAEPPGDAAPGT